MFGSSSRSSAASRTGRVLALCALLLAWALPSAAAADHAFEVTVLIASPDAGKVDGRAQRFDRLLRKRLRYESLRFVSNQRSRVALEEIVSVPVRGSKPFRFRPIDASGNGVLVAVDWETRGEFQIHKGKPLILGGPASRGGDLVVILEAR